MRNQEQRVLRIKKIGGILFLIFCVCAIGYTIYQYNELKKNPNLLYGEVKDVSYLSKGSGYFVTYHFSFNNELITAKSSIPYAGFRQILFIDSLLKGKSLPVIYQPNNPNNNRMLLTHHDYEEYKIDIPPDVSNIIRQIDSLINAYH
jgi:hypothetical protein